MNKLEKARNWLDCFNARCLGAEAAHADNSDRAQYYALNADRSRLAIDELDRLHSALLEIANSDESTGTLKAIARTAVEE